jgi:hypothetical protein
MGHTDIVAQQLREERTKRHRDELDRTGPLIEPQRIGEVIDLVRQSGDREPAAMQIFPFRLARESVIEPAMDADQDLQGLAQIMARHRQQGRAKTAGLL